MCHLNRLHNGEGLKLGDLSGNRFKTTIRRLESSSAGASLDEEALKSAVVSLQTNGFINYFGLQRFGSCLHAPTHAIGR